MNRTERLAAGAVAALLMTGVATAVARSGDRTSQPVATAAPVPSTAPAPVVQVVDNSELSAARATIDELRTRLAERKTAAEAAKPSTLVVTGVARIPSTPDVLRLSIGVSVKRPTVKEALDGASRAATRVIESLKANGVAAKDIRTEHVNVHENWNHAGRDGYVASHSVAAKLRDVGRAGAVMGAAAEAGGDDVRLHGLAFDLEENKGPLAEARKAAMADARTRAEDLARLAGRKLGRVLAVDDNSQPAGRTTMGQSHSAVTADSGAFAGDIPVEPGTVDSVFRVTVVFALD